MKIGERITTDVLQITEHFNNYFLSVFTRGDNHVPRSAGGLTETHEGMLLHVNLKKSLRAGWYPKCLSASACGTIYERFFNSLTATGYIPDE